MHSRFSSPAVAVFVSSLSTLLGCAGSKSPLADADPALVPIDDMEGSTAAIAWRPAVGADGTTPGHWDSEAGIQCGNLSPLPAYLGGDWTHTAVPEPYETEPGVISRHAARLFTTAPLVNTWGATLAFDFAKEPLENNEPIMPGDPGDPDTCTPPAGVERDSLTPARQVDLRAYRGVTFFGRSVEAGGARVFVKLHDSNTDPRGRHCDQVVGSEEECYNSFGELVALDAEFRRHTVDFADFTQEVGWGYRPPSRAPDLEHVYGLVFEIRTLGGPCDPPSICAGPPPELSFDVWIDDLAFVER